MDLKKKFNLFKLLQNVAVVGLFLVVGLGVLFGTNLLPRTSYAIEFTFIAGLLLLGILIVLPWAKYLEQKEYKIVSLVFLIATAICVILWELSTILIFSAYRNQTGNAGIIQLVRITLVISIQVIIASFIGKFIIKYHAKYIPFQVIAYMSMLFLDFYLSTLLFGIQIGTDEITFSSNVSNLLFHNRVILGFLILSAVYLGVAYGVINEARKRRVRNTILAKNRKLNKDIGLMDLDDEDEEDLKNAPVANDAEAQLEKIKSMFDKGLITKEEYDAKRQTIIDKM